MAELKIVKGNDFYLKIKVTKKIVGGSSTEPLSLANVSDLKISLINIRETVLPTTLSTDELGVCYSLVSGLAVGTYDLQLTGKYNGNPIRSCELKTVTIVNNNASSNVTPNTYEGEDAYNVDIAVMLFTGSTGISDAPEDGKEYARKDGEWVEVDAIPGIVDNLSSNDSTKTLSAKQGKVLDGKVSDIASDVTQIKGQLTQLPTVVAQAQGAVASEEQLKAKVESLCGFSAIDDFDAETDYLINDICTKEGKVWRCINTHTGAWDASHFVETSLAELVQTMCAGAMENVKIEMSCEDEVSWDDYNVIVENVSAGETNTYAVDEDGVVEFTIPKGDVYSVSFPAIDTYIQPADRQFIAQNGDRVIRVTYSQAPEKNETINIHATVHSFDEGTSALLDGSVFYAKNDSGTVIATTTMSSGLAVLTIPYGTHYTLHMADLDGYTHNHRSDVHTAGVVSRDVLVTYSAIGYGVYGLDSEGNVYTTEQVAELENKDIIIAVAYNDSYLNSADRGDGTTGCGFCWLVTSPTMNKQWATSNVEFDKTRLPFVTKDADGLLVCQGEKNTELIMEIGSELGVGTPAATWCNESVLTIGGVDKNGFLPACGQLRRLALNQSLIDEFYTALGKTKINILSGGWWTSCQYSASLAVGLNGGLFSNNGKALGFTALRVFDL